MHEFFRCRESTRSIAEVTTPPIEVGAVDTIRRGCTRQYDAVIPKDDGSQLVIVLHGDVHADLFRSRAQSYAVHTL